MWQWFTMQAFSHKSVPTWGKLMVFWKSFKRLPYFTSPSFSRVFHNIFIVSITLIICSTEKSIIPHYNWVFKDITNAEGSVIFCSIFLVRNTGCQAMTWVLRGMNDRSILSQKMGLGSTHSFVKCTPPFRPLSNTPLPLPPAKIWAFRTISFASKVSKGIKKRELELQDAKKKVLQIHCGATVNAGLNPACNNPISSLCFIVSTHTTTHNLSKHTDKQASKEEIRSEEVFSAVIWF